MASASSRVAGSFARRARQLEAVRQRVQIVPAHLVVEHTRHLLESPVHLPAHVPAGRAPHPQVHEHGRQEEGVDDGRRGGREVVVALRDELAHLVDEQAHAAPAEHRAQEERPAIGEHEQHQRAANSASPPHSTWAMWMLSLPICA